MWARNGRSYRQRWAQWVEQNGACAHGSWTRRLQACALSLALPLLASCDYPQLRVYVVRCPGQPEMRVMGDDILRGDRRVRVTLRGAYTAVADDSCTVYAPADSARATR